MDPFFLAIFELLCYFSYSSTSTSSSFYSMTTDWFVCRRRSEHRSPRRLTDGQVCDGSGVSSIDAGEGPANDGEGCGPSLGEFMRKDGYMCVFFNLVHERVRE